MMNSITLGSRLQIDSMPYSLHFCKFIIVYNLHFYQGKNGNHFFGQWKNGALNGNGTLICANGNRDDDFWEDGLPKGNGNFRWADGSFYMGTWSKDPKEQSGTYYPSSSLPEGNLDYDPHDVFSVGLNDCKICPLRRSRV
ncbi:hypothetical protein NE237_017921 [Protea cynaroides]|uniref:Uncharacterized protein n=1 Tax=Protea cynaroides TaxID=273540 RepID=A0A9Q0QNH5_9MAGN|nr:hypothetical protein NE237_017921 [Protea cynaroides]